MKTYTRISSVFLHFGYVLYKEKHSLSASEIKEIYNFLKQPISGTIKCGQSLWRWRCLAVGCMVSEQKGSSESRSSESWTLLKWPHGDTDVQGKNGCKKCVELITCLVTGGVSPPHLTSNSLHHHPPFYFLLFLPNIPYCQNLRPPPL